MGRVDSRLSFRKKICADTAARARLPAPARAVAQAYEAEGADL